MAQACFFFPCCRVSFGLCRRTPVSLLLRLATPLRADVGVRLTERHGFVDVFRGCFQRGNFLAQACARPRAVSVGDGALPESRDIATKHSAVKLLVGQLAAASLPCVCNDTAAKVVEQKLP